LTVTHDGRVAWIALARPQVRNAINQELLIELGAAIDALSADPEVRVIVIRGEGVSFSAGFDVSGKGYLTDRDPIEDWTNLRWRISQFLKLWDCPKPVVAAVHGACIGGATQLCAFCDLVIVAEDASIGAPALPLGAGYVAPLFALTMGARRAKELALVPGLRMTGVEAAERGWATTAVPADALLAEAGRYARLLANVPPEIAAANKLSINRVAELQGFRQAVMQAGDLDAIAHGSSAVRAVAAEIDSIGLRAAIERYTAADDAR
jgi:enoyl-CoA hydratase